MEKLGVGLADRTLEQFSRDLKAAGSGGVQRAAKRLMAQLAGMGEEYAKDHYGDNGLGVVTGRLKQSIIGRTQFSCRSLQMFLQAGNDAQVNYAAQHEFGLFGLPARPFISPAIEWLRGEMPQELWLMTRAQILDQPWTPK